MRSQVQKGTDPYSELVPRSSRNHPFWARLLVSGTVVISVFRGDPSRTSICTIGCTYEPDPVVEVMSLEEVTV